MIKRLLSLRSYLILFPVLFFLSSCASRYSDALFTSQYDGAIDSLKTVYVVNNSNQPTDFYRIKPNDLLSIRNLQDISLVSTGDSKGSVNSATIFRVDADGSVILPGLGAVPVGGLSRQQATGKIQSEYKRTLLKDPIIELSIVNLKVTLLGEFASQGEFLLDDDEVNVIDIIGKAGGLSPRADPKSLKIIRGDRLNPEIIYVNLKNINSLGNPKLILQNNDILYIEPLGSFNTSDRLQRASSVLQPILLVINFALIVYNFTK